MTAAELHAELLKAAAEPLFGIATTVAAYAVSAGLHRRFRWLHPLLPTCGALIALLLLGHIPYESYKRGGDLIVFFLGPATVALGVPLYKQAKQIRRHVLALATGIAAGSAAGIGSAALFVWLFHGSHVVLLSMLPKSVTTPISMALAEQLQGDPKLTAVFTVIAGLIGSIAGPRLLRLCGVRGDLAIGAAMGASSHGIGAARVIRENELQGGVAGLAMALAGILTSLMMIPVQWWLRR